MSQNGRENRVRASLEKLRLRAGDDNAPSEASPDSDMEAPGVEDVTGRTIFGDRPPPLHNLTGEPAEGSLSDPGFLAQAFKIRLARSRASSQQAGTLVERRYAWRGCGVPRRPGVRKA